MVRPEFPSLSSLPPFLLSSLPPPLTFGSLHHRILSRANLLSATTATALLKVRLSAKWRSQQIRNGRFRLSLKRRRDGRTHTQTHRVALVWRRQAMIVKPLQKTTFGTARGLSRAVSGGRERYRRSGCGASEEGRRSRPTLTSGLFVCPPPGSPPFPFCVPYPTRSPFGFELS